MKQASKFVIFLEYENLENYFSFRVPKKLGFHDLKNMSNLEVFAATRRLDDGLDIFLKHNPLISEE